MASSSLPFKNPFKGKRALFRQLSEARRALTAHEQAVTLLVSTWRDQAGATGIVLTYETRSGKLRWRGTRRVHGHQRVLEFDSPEIIELRSALSTEAMCLLIGFEHRRARLNALIAIARATIDALENYVVAARVLEDSAPETLQTPLISESR